MGTWGMGSKCQGCRAGGCSLLPSWAQGDHMAWVAPHQGARKDSDKPKDCPSWPQPPAAHLQIFLILLIFQSQHLQHPGPSPSTAMAWGTASSHSNTGADASSQQLCAMNAMQ